MIAYFLFVTQGIDVKSMGRIFVGIVKCGAWGCFDEFNRLEEAVLSAVSMQIQSIQASLLSGSKETTLLEKKVSFSKEIYYRYHSKEIKRERERETGRERERPRQRQRERDRDRDKERETETETKRERERQRERGSERER